MSDEGEHVHAVTACNPIAEAPKDGTLLRLRMDYTTPDDAHAYSNALWDTAQLAWTIGFNQFDHTGDDVWQYAGWDWNGDEFEKGSGGVPVGWLPFHGEQRDADDAELIRLTADVSCQRFECICGPDLTAGCELRARKIINAQRRLPTISAQEIGE